MYEQFDDTTYVILVQCRSSDYFHSFQVCHLSSSIFDSFLYSIKMNSIFNVLRALMGI